MNRNHVARNYFFTYFSIDFLSTFPIFIISCKADYIFYFSEALTLLKMFRIGTFLKYVKRLAQVSIYLYLICFKILSRVQVIQFTATVREDYKQNLKKNLIPTYRQILSNQSDSIFIRSTWSFTNDKYSMNCKNN